MQLLLKFPLHYNLCITLLLGSKPISVLAIHSVYLCYNESKVHSYIGKLVLYDHLGSSFESCYIQNHVIMNPVIKRLMLPIKQLNYI